MKSLIRAVLLIGILSSFVAGCTNAPANNLAVAQEEKLDTLALLSQKWKTDSMGCAHVRSQRLFEDILNGYKLGMSTNDAFKSIYGIPNILKKENGRIVFVYYIESICRSNKVVGDRTMIYVYFDEHNRFSQTELLAE